MLLDALGAIRFRRGEVDEAAASYNAANRLETCAGWLHYDLGRYMNLNGLYASAQKELGIAHRLAPSNALITRNWERSQQAPVTEEERIAQYRRQLEAPGLNAEQKAALANDIKTLETRGRGSCELVQPVTATTLPLLQLGNAGSSRGSSAVGTDVVFNGKRKRLQVDTGAGGLLITEATAKSLGLVAEAEVKIGGIGDEGPRDSYITHVDNLRLGEMEFKNCLVQVVAGKSTLQADGLLGPDIFRAYVVTLDFPMHEMRLSPLPKRPDDQTEAARLNTQEDTPTTARQPRDRYVAPEMKDWTKVFRYGHDLIFATTIGNVPKKLFVMDTGAGLNMISQTAAREVTGVEGVDGIVEGLNGKVKDVANTGAISITVAGVRMVADEGLRAIDMSKFTRSAGVELAGFLGYPLLKEFVISIDYRDNLVHLALGPHVKGRGNNLQ